MLGIFCVLFIFCLDIGSSLDDNKNDSVESTLIILFDVSAGSPGTIPPIKVSVRFCVSDRDKLFTFCVDGLFAFSDGLFAFCGVELFGVCGDGLFEFRVDWLLVCGCPITDRQIGQLLCVINHRSIHEIWNLCPHAVIILCTSPLWKSFIQIEHNSDDDSFTTDTVVCAITCSNGNARSFSSNDECEAMFVFKGISWNWILTPSEGDEFEKSDSSSVLNRSLFCDGGDDGRAEIGLRICDCGCGCDCVSEEKLKLNVILLELGIIKNSYYISLYVKD